MAHREGGVMNRNTTAVWIDALIISVMVVSSGITCHFIGYRQGRLYEREHCGMDPAPPDHVSFRVYAERITNDLTWTIPPNKEGVVIFVTAERPNDGG